MVHFTFSYLPPSGPSLDMLFLLCKNGRCRMYGLLIPFIPYVWCSPIKIHISYQLTVHWCISLRIITVQMYLFCAKMLQLTIDRGHKVTMALRGLNQCQQWACSLRTQLTHHRSTKWLLLMKLSIKSTENKLICYFLNAWFKRNRPFLWLCFAQCTHSHHQ